MIAATKTYLQFLFGQHIRKLRLDKGLTQVDLSSRMNKDQQSLQRLESGKVSPSLFYLYTLSVALDITLSELLDFDTRKRKRGM